jgi:predicted aldo/keto reductase-like oxidoreductase
MLQAHRARRQARDGRQGFAQSVSGVALTVIGMGSQKELEQNVEWAKSFKPLTATEAEELKKKSVALAKQWGAPPRSAR